MVKKILFFLVACTFVFAIQGHNAFAASVLTFENYAAFYPTKGLTTAPVTEFNFDQIPSLYVKLLEAPGGIALQVTSTTWTWGSGSSAEKIDLGSDIVADSTSNAFWVTPDAKTWSAHRQVGEWSVSGQTMALAGDGFHAFSGNTTFNVKAAPEPISSALFLLGAAVFGLKGRLRKKGVARSTVA